MNHILFILLFVSTALFADQTHVSIHNNYDADVSSIIQQMTDTVISGIRSTPDLKKDKFGVNYFTAKEEASFKYTIINTTPQPKNYDFLVLKNYRAQPLYADRESIEFGINPKFVADIDFSIRPSQSLDDVLLIGLDKDNALNISTRITLAKNNDALPMPEQIRVLAGDDHDEGYFYSLDNLPGVKYGMTNKPIYADRSLFLNYGTEKQKKELIKVVLFVWNDDGVTATTVDGSFQIGGSKLVSIPINTNLPVKGHIQAMIVHNPYHSLHNDGELDVESVSHIVFTDRVLIAG